MKYSIFVLFLLIDLVCQAASFTDPFSGMTLEIPSDFEFNEEESKMDQLDNTWWYAFIDCNQNVLTIEIEKYENNKTLPEFFHHSMTNEEENVQIIFEGFEFKNQMIGGIEFTKSKLRLLAISDQYIEPLYLCDYLFVNDQYGFTISLMQKNDDTSDNASTDAMMQKLLESIRF